MGFPATLKDAQGVPVSSVYMPGVGWAALQGSLNSNTDANGISAPAMMTMWDFIQDQIMQGHGFQSTTGLISTGANNAFVCMQAAVNNISKNVLLFGISVFNSNTANDGRIYTANVATADSSLSALTAYNMQPKSATASVLTTLAGSAASTTQTSGFTGNQSFSFGSAGSTLLQLVTNSGVYFFAKGDTASVEVAQKIPTSGNSASINMKWIEWA